MNILLIGLGNMGSVIASALLESSHLVYAVDPHKIDKNSAFTSNNVVYSDISEASAAIHDTIEMIVLAVKPQILNAILEELAPYLNAHTIVLSTVAGVPLDAIQEKLTYNGVRPKKAARMMPTIAAKKRESITGLCYTTDLSSQEKKKIYSLVAALGKVVEVPESLMSAITGLSGSGIAFVAKFIDAMVMAGVREGLAYTDSYQATLQTVRGCLSLLGSSQEGAPVFQSAHELITAVCSPGGTTIEGMHELQKHGMEPAVGAAVHAASEKAKQLALPTQ